MMEDNKSIKLKNMNTLQMIVETNRRIQGGNMNILALAGRSKIEEDDHYEIDDELGCLGVPPYILYPCNEPFFTSLVQNDTVFGKLPRRVNPPVSDCPIVLTKSRLDCQELIIKLWNGDCMFKINGPIPKTRNDKLEILIWISPEWPAPIDIDAIICTIGFNFHPERGNSIRGNFFDPLGRYLNVKQQELLAARVLHQVLRQFGCRLPWLFLEPIFEMLNIIWSQSKKYKKLILDCCIIKADLMCNVPSAGCSESLASVKFAIADALDALGHFEESENLCLETAGKKHTTPDELARAYLKAGISCNRDVRYDASLSHLLNALRIMTLKSESFDWSHGDANSVISILVDTHDKIAEDERIDSYYSEGVRKLGSKEVLFASLSCLLVFAKFSPEDKVVLDYFRDTKVFAQKLKPIYHKHYNAKQLLLRAFCSETVEQYKETLLEAVKGPGNVVIHYKMKPPRAKKDDHSKRVEAKRQATHILKDQSGMLERLCRNCRMVEPPDKDFKNCQCHIVSYCSKECQVEDWKIHKRTCPWHLEQKKKNKG